MKIIMLKGLPGSGKSTWAKAFVGTMPGWVRINKDSLRDMMGSYRPGKDEQIILKWRDEIIMQSLVSGKNVVIDDTNFHPKHEKQLRMIAEKFQAEFQVMQFSTPVEECIENDLKRPNSVGEKVIRKMWREFLYQKYEAPINDPLIPWSIICDLDGTLALHNGRSPYETGKCESDKINPVVLNILRSWQQNNKHGQTIFVSGREDKFREITKRWLDKIGFTDGDYLLFMRPTEDFRRDDIVKEEIYLTQILKKYNVEFVLDDRNRVVDMWRRNGLTCLQVAEGDF